MKLETSIDELNICRSYLEKIDRTEITHIIKYTIFLIEKNNQRFKEIFSEQDLTEINKVPLTNDINNNLFFKYRKITLPISTVAFIQSESLIIFSNSILFNFKLCNPMALKPISEDQNLVIDLFKEALLELNINNDFIKIIL